MGTTFRAYMRAIISRYVTDHRINFFTSTHIDSGRRRIKNASSPDTGGRRDDGMGDAAGP